MQKNELCEFGIKAKVKLVQINKTSTWLANEVHKNTGLYVDTAYLSHIFTGKRKAPKVVNAIKDILQMEP